MTSTTLPLRKPPIIEAILDIDCDFAPNRSIVDQEKPAADKLQDRYPKPRKLFVQAFKIEVSPNPPTRNEAFTPSVGALQFLQEDEKQIIQFRESGYTFNRLAPYGSLDEYLPEIQRTWKIFNELSAPSRILAIKLRYINRLDLPFENHKTNLDDYLKFGPRSPDENHLEFEGFLTQQQLIEKDTGYRIMTVLATKGIEGANLPVMFDNTVSAKVDIDPADWRQIEGTIRSLRTLKNLVFSKTLTEKCLESYQ